jgi:predicted Zn-dependent protease
MLAGESTGVVAMSSGRLAAAAVILALTASVLTGCATAPETGRSQVLLISTADEARMGFKTFEELKAKKPRVTGGKDWEMLQRVGRRIAAVARLPHARWEFVLFKDDANANAFALPGGKVGVYTGMLPVTRNEAGLATVIGHEVAHATARHGAERLSHSLLIQLGGTALSAALGSSSPATRDMAMDAYGIGTSLGVALPYSRTQELEADGIGLLYMARAGFDPNDAVQFWRRFAEYSRKRGGSPPEFLSTHPLDERRIAAIEAQLPRAMAEYRRVKKG